MCLTPLTLTVVVMCFNLVNFMHGIFESVDHFLLIGPEPPCLISHNYAGSSLLPNKVMDRLILVKETQSGMN